MGRNDKYGHSAARSSASTLGDDDDVRSDGERGCNRTELKVSSSELSAAAAAPLIFIFIFFFVSSSSYSLFLFFFRSSSPSLISLSLIPSLSSLRPFCLFPSLFVSFICPFLLRPFPSFPLHSGLVFFLCFSFPLAPTGEGPRVERFVPTLSRLPSTLYIYGLCVVYGFDSSIGRPAP